MRWIAAILVTPMVQGSADFARRPFLGCTYTSKDLPALTWRSFRRSAELLMHENGVSLKAKSAMLGHTNVNTTMLYAETNEGAKRAAEVLSSLFCLNLAQEASRAM
jgi:hypothetical protein